MIKNLSNKIKSNGNTEFGIKISDI